MGAPVFAHQLQHMIVTRRAMTGSRTLDGDRLRANLRQCEIGRRTWTPGRGVGGGMVIAGSIPPYVVSVISARQDITAVMCLLTVR